MDLNLDPNYQYSTYLGYSARALDPNWQDVFKRALAKPTARLASLGYIEDLVRSEGVDRARELVELVESAKGKIEEQWRKRKELVSRSNARDCDKDLADTFPLRCVV